MVNLAAGSFRDRTARVFHEGPRLLRALSPRAGAEWDYASACESVQTLVEQRDVVGTRKLHSAEYARGNAPEWAHDVLEHEALPFINYPYEWCFSMLRDAALLHLKILKDCLADDVTLKDATPYNIVFQGSRPVFVDIGSFVQYQAGEPWVGYRQFCELFLIPLLLQAHRNVPFQELLRSNLEGIPPQEARRWFSLRDLLRPGVFVHVWLHGWLQGLAANGALQTPKNSATDVRHSRESIRRLLEKLERVVQRLSWTPPKSVWTEYAAAQPHVRRDRDFKSAFVDESCRLRHCRLVWDIGCNEGHYSRIAAKHADYVVAMDLDRGCIERLYRDLRTNGPDNILPLTVNLANPSPDQGWRGRERLRLEHRGRPDLVLCLGLIHHLVIGCHVPLTEFVDWLGELGADVVIEFPEKSDPLVQQLLAHKRDDYDDYSLDTLIAALHQHFEVERCERVPDSDRRLLFARHR